MSKPVGVVAVLRGAQEYVAHCAGNCDPDYLEMVQAIDAVAELIAAVDHRHATLRRGVLASPQEHQEAVDRVATALAACKAPM